MAIWKQVLIMNKEKKWYKVTYDGGWFKADTIEDIINTVSGPGNFYEGRIKRIIEVTERDIDETLKLLITKCE